MWYLSPLGRTASLLVFALSMTMRIWALQEVTIFLPPHNSLLCDAFFCLITPGKTASARWLAQLRGEGNG